MAVAHPPLQSISININEFLAPHGMPRMECPAWNPPPHQILISDHSENHLLSYIHHLAIPEIIRQLPTPHYRKSDADSLFFFFVRIRVFCIFESSQIAEHCLHSI